jgi:2-polyprenyl-6-methoxyphenol hydroxylase-like FAD-dependent oxidoreductase
MTNRDNFDVVIVGAGIAGGSLATRLARDGMSVLLLERTLVHIDRIRGEFLAPWGVQEARQLGLLAELLAAGGHYLTKSMRYGDGVPIASGRANPINLAALVPGVQGVMTLGHPCLCDTLDHAAMAAGATLLRGVSGISVEPGMPPAIAFEYEGGRHTIRPRLVVGADGRGSPVGRQIGARTETDPVHHLIAGLLIEGVPAWPDDEQSVNVHSGVYLLVFPQGNGRVRLYACYAREERGRFSGPNATANFLDAFRVPTLPHANDLAGGRIAGPCQGYPNADAWVDDPTAPGVVLIGDAAGHNDPTIGQGLSITFRDVRLVAEALSSAAEWGAGLFDHYVAERRERMRRLRFTGRLWAKLRCEFDAEAAQRRVAFGERVARNPAAGRPMLTPLIGPVAQSGEAFGETAVKQLLGDDWSLTEDGWFRKTTHGDGPEGGLAATSD